MRFTLRISRELYSWLTEQAGTDDSDERARRTAIRRWFYGIAGVEAPAKTYQAYPKSYDSTAEIFTILVDLTEEAGAKICELAGVAASATASERNIAVRAWLYSEAGLPIPPSAADTARRRARERYHTLKRKAEAFDALTSEEASDGSAA